MLEITIQEVPDSAVNRPSRLDNSTYRILSTINSMELDKWYKIGMQGFTGRQAHSKVYHVKKKYDINLSMVMVNGELHVKKFQ